MDWSKAKGNVFWTKIVFYIVYGPFEDLIFPTEVKIFKFLQTTTNLACIWSDWAHLFTICHIGYWGVTRCYPWHKRNFQFHWTSYLKTRYFTSDIKIKAYVIFNVFKAFENVKCNINLQQRACNIKYVITLGLVRHIWDFLGVLEIFWSGRCFLNWLFWW